MEFSETQKVQKESQSLKALTLFALFSYLPRLTAPLPSFGFVDFCPILTPAGFLPLAANIGAAEATIKAAITRATTKTVSMRFTIFHLLCSVSAFLETKTGHRKACLDLSSW